MKLGLARRSFRIDGGAERSTLHFVDACRTLEIELELATASKIPHPPMDVSVYPLDLSGWSRVSRSRSFRQSVSNWVAGSDCDLYQSNEWANDVDILRLGDGLHSHWLEIIDADDSLLRSTVRALSPFHRDRLRSEREALGSKSLKAVICNSEFVRDRLKKVYPAVSDRAVVIYNPSTLCAVDVSREPDPEGHFWLGFAGSGWYRKGLDYAISALAQMPTEVRLKVVGRDSDHQKYQNLASELGVGDRVIFYGVVEDMQSFYQSIDALIHPARYDPCPNAAIEAISLDIPVIISACTGMADFEGESGLQILPPDHSANSIVHATAAIMQGRGGAPSAEFKKTFHFETFCSSLDRFYRGLL